ncbi:MAG: hypothetical protein ACK5NN_05690 [Sphingomonadaceae bacterium]
MKLHRPFAAALSLAALFQIPTAQAQSCITETEVADLLVYAMPLAIDGVYAKCSATASKQGFLNSGSSKLRSKYAALTDQSWPGARSALLKFASSRDKATSFGDLGQLPDNAVRPLIDAIIIQKVSQETKPESCMDIERGLGLIAPFKPRDTSALLAFVAGMANLRSPDVCPVNNK